MGRLVKGGVRVRAVGLLGDLEVVVTGTYLPGEPETVPTYGCGGTPAVPEDFEDVEVVGFVDPRATEGVDTSSPSVRRLLKNLCAMHAEAMRDALLDAVPEDDDRG